MKTLLNKTSTLVAASIAMGSLAYTSSAFAQYGPVSLGGEISLGFQQYDTTVPAGHIYEPISRSDVVAQTGGFQLEIAIIQAAQHLSLYHSISRSHITALDKAVKGRNGRQLYLSLNDRLGCHPVIDVDKSQCQYQCERR